MIQRIQTIFLFLAVVFSGVLFFLPVASFGVGAEVVKLSVFGTETQNTLLLLIFNILALLVPLVTIFLYKKRELQLKLSSLTVFLNSVLVGLIFLYYSTNIQEKLAAETIVYLLGTYIPLINMVLSILAMRWIKKDIELIKSVDRLR